MRIQHNIMALNAYRNYNNNIGTLSKNLEKLSSGYRINRAGDDAAGLAISEKMRAQITGLDAAQKNVKDGISLVKTAEGALQEVQDMMNRMKYLATQSANGTYDNEVDRANLQKEVDALKTEINRIADSANFNGQKLLNGELASEKTVVNTIAPEDMPKAMVATGDTIKTKFTDATKHLSDITITTKGTAAGKVSFEYMDTDGSIKSASVSLDSEDIAAITAASGTEVNKTAEILADKINNDETLSKMFNATSTAAKLSIEAKVAGADSPYVTKVDFGTSGAAASTGVARTTKGTDSYILLDKDGLGATATSKLTPTELKDGATITLGDKTFEILADVAKVKEGNIAVNLGTSADLTIDNLVAAMKANGIESAEAYDLDTSAVVAAGAGSADSIKIGDLSEISVAQKGVAVESNTAGVSLENTIDKAGVYKVTAADTGAAAATTFTMTVEYLDAEGNKKTKDINYDVEASAVAADVAKAMTKALKNDEELSSLFEIKADTADVKFTAKDAGTDGARLIGMKTNDPTASALSEVKIDEEAKDAGLEIDVYVKNINEGDTVTVDGKTYEFVKNLSDTKDGNIGVLIDDSGATAPEDDKLTAKNLALAMQNEGIDAKYDAATGKISIKNDAAAPSEEEVEVGGLTLQIGDTADNFNQMNVSVGDMHVEALGIGDLDISSLEGAQAAVDTITNAINTVSSTRGDLGAIQNRLEHTTNNLAVMKENITDAESSIRDTDVADEMMKYTKNNILIQSAQAMLAQANAVPQGVLQLLQ